MYSVRLGSQDASLLSWRIPGTHLPLLATTVTIPDVLVNGSVKAETISHVGELDGPKVSPGVNATSYDW